MKKGFVLLGVALFAISVIRCSNKKEESVKGIIVDAAMNTMMVRTFQGDTVTVSTMDADISAKDGILTGDTVEIWLVKSQDADIPVAGKVIVNPVARPSLVGSWVEPIPGMDGVQGVELNENGIATSVNMATLQYEKWSKSGDSLMLYGKSIGNGQTIDFIDTLYIQKLSSDSLILTNQFSTIYYKRQ